MDLIEKVTESLKEARKRKSHSLAEAGKSLGKRDDTVSNWEKGKIDFKLSDLTAIAKYVGCSVQELLFGKQPEKKDNGVFEVEIYTKEDRLNVAKILLDNGYAVSTGKRNKTPTGKQVIYFLRVSKDPNAIVDEG